MLRNFPQSCGTWLIGINLPAAMEKFHTLRLAKQM